MDKNSNNKSKSRFANNKLNNKNKQEPKTIITSEKSVPKENNVNDEMTI